MSKTLLAIALERIAECRSTRAIELDLSELGLDEIPPEVFELTWLKKLDMSGIWPREGKIKIIPAAIRQLTSLTTIYLSSNQISDLSPFINLHTLQTLDCCYNHISDLSPLDNLPVLQILYCSKNQITDLRLSDLPALQTLDCSSNQIIDLTLGDLPALQTLDCSSNQIIDLNIGNLPVLQTLICRYNAIINLILNDLPALQTLDCSSNRIIDLSPLGTLPALQTLDCRSNKIIDLSPLGTLPALQTLDCRSNKIIDLSPLGDLPALQLLDCSYNFIQNISPLDRLILSGQLAVLRSYSTPQLGIPPILSDSYLNCIEDVKYYRQAILMHGSVTQKQLKIQLVGNGRVGKTTLAIALETGKLVEQDCQSTHGITIKTIPFKSYDDEIIDLNLWDFGGQEVYHATHRLFFAYDCVYLLLWAEETEEDSNEMRYPPSYWLEAIQDLGGNSPVIIIKNQIDRAKSKSYIPADINVDELAQKHEFVGISAKKYQGMYKLRGIIDELLHDPDVQTKVELPNSWVAVQTQLAELKTSCKTISFMHFQQLCHQAGIDYADWFVDYLHRIGVLFYCENAFHNQIILDQNWAIDAAYRVFNPQGLRDEIEEKRGRFKGKFTRVIWPEVDDTERQIYLSFMHQCGVCYEPRRRDNYEKNLPFAQREFIVPALLPKTSKAKSAWGERRADDWQLEIEYPFLHRSIIERLILRLGETYESEAWRTGIFCETEFGQVLLEAITPSKATSAGYLHFTLRAKQQSNVLVQVLRQLIDKISPHQRYKTYLQQGRQPRAELPAFKKQDKNLIISRLDPVKPDKTIRLFISYSRIDYKHKLTLEKHLRLLKETLKHKVMLMVWSDNRMDAGDGVNEQILRELRRADLIVLLVSADFLDPERYSRRVELPIALERFEKEQTPVIPVILSAVNWQEQLGHLTVATKENADPLEDWRSPHKFWQSVENGIRAQVEKRLAKLCEQDD